MPIWIADFVLADVGTGAVVGVPGHDKRDFEFAKEFGLEIKRVVVGSDTDTSEIKDISQVQEEEGKMINSGFLDGLDIYKATIKMMDYLEEKDWGVRITNYHLRDWLVSRQRYWGAPIPMIYCKKCAKDGKSWLSEVSKEEKSNKLTNEIKLLHKDLSDWDPSGWYPEENLPVELPDIENFKPEGEGRGPLANHPEFYDVKCPVCGSDAKREMDVLDTFVDSSWYFLRYPSVGSKSSKKHPFDREITKKWLPVDLYFGGAEHSVLHLMYSRFVWMTLRDMGYLDYKNGGFTSKKTPESGWDEPFPRFYAHGLMIKDGAKMSKSRGNVVNPDEYIEKFGADTLRLYLMFMGPMDGYPDFRDTGIEGMRRFVDRVWRIYQDSLFINTNDQKIFKDVNIKMHHTIKKVTEDIQDFRFNTAIAAIMEYVNLIREVASKSQKSKDKSKKFKTEKNANKVWEKALETLVLLLAPFAPHITEEVWVNILGQKFSIHKNMWPRYDPDLVKEDEVTMAVQVNGKLRTTVKMNAGDSKKKDIVIKTAMDNEKIKTWLKDKEIAREVFVPGKILNIVTKN
jgi:leucyl-tRNA synthetase